MRGRREFSAVIVAIVVIAGLPIGARAGFAHVTPAAGITHVQYTHEVPPIVDMPLYMSERADLMWRQTVNSESQVSSLCGSTLLSQVSFAGGAPPSFETLP